MLFGSSGFAQTSIISTYAGPEFPADGSQALTQTIGVPQAISADGAGGFYIGSNQNKVYHVMADGRLMTLAGSGVVGFSGDNGPASSARFNYLQGVAADGAGNVFVADSKNNRIRKISPAGVITTVAGNGGAGLSGDGGPAVSAHLAGPRGLAVDRAGNLFIADAGNNTVRMVTPSGIIKTVAGNGTAGFSGDGGPAAAATLNQPVAVAVDAAGNISISDQHNNRIRMVTAAGVIKTSAVISNPGGIAADAAGNVFVADIGTNRVRMVSPDGSIHTVAGTGVPGFSGDGGPAVSARFTLPVDVAADGIGNLFVADQANYRIRRIDAAGLISSVAGKSDDGNSPLAAQFFFQNTIATDRAGNLYIADTDVHRIRKITNRGVMTIVAGNGTGGFSGDGGSATSAQLYYPAGITVDAAGNLFIADTRNERIRKVTPGGIISTIAGAGSAGGAGGAGGDGGPALQAEVNEPAGVTVDSAGNVFIAETGSHRIRRINPAGVITTIAGNKTMGFSGDGGPGTSAQLAFPAAVAVDAAGNVFIADSVNNRIRRVAPNGIITTVVGTGTIGFSGDGGPATAAHITYPQAIAIDGSGDLFIADTNNQRIRKVTPDGIIRSVAGTGAYGFSGDGGSAIAAEITSPYGIAVDGANTLFISDTFSNRIRKIVLTEIPFTLVDRGGTLLASTGTSATIQTGYAQIEATGSTPPAALAIFSDRAGALISETGILAAPALSSGRIYAEIDGPLQTGVAIANPNSQTATIRFFYTDAAGHDLGSGTATIGANQQIARFLDAEPFNTFGGGSFQGTFSFTSDVPVGAIAIRGLLNERGEFLMSALPVIDTSAATPMKTIVVPHFANGGGWTTQILLVNPGEGPLSGLVEFHDDAGNLTGVTIDGQSDNSFTYTIPPHSSRKLVPDGSGAAAVTGSVRVVPADGAAAPVPLINFSYRPGGTLTVTQASVPSVAGTALRVYVESDGTDGRPNSTQSAIAIANDGASENRVTLELTNLDGSKTGLPPDASVALPAFAHAARFLPEVFPGLPNPFKGVLRVSTPSQDVSVIGLRTRYNERGEFLITTTPPVSETAAARTEPLLVPHLPDGGGFATELILFSADPGQAVSGSIGLFQQSGEPFAVPLR
ncbi:MAG TPA: NHL repeat-containing protein [Terriglobia bacterium]|jgi:sugar lactone lactonase YvrE